MFALDQVEVRAAPHVKVVDSRYNILLDDVPASFEEISRVAIRPWRFIRRQTGDGLFDFLLRESMIKSFLNLW